MWVGERVRERERKRGSQAREHMLVLRAKPHRPGRATHTVRCTAAAFATSSLSNIKTVALLSRTNLEGYIWKESRSSLEKRCQPGPTIAGTHPLTSGVLEDLASCSNPCQSVKSSEKYSPFEYSDNNSNNRSLQRAARCSLFTNAGI